MPSQATPRSALPIPTPVVVPRGEIPSNAVITTLALSNNGGCALADGDVYCSHTTGFKRPVRITSGDRGSGTFIDVESDDFTCALTNEGAAYSTGTAEGARFGTGSDAFLTVPVLGRPPSKELLIFASRKGR